MGEARHSLVRPAANPPAGSRLANLADHFDKLMAEGEPELYELMLQGADRNAEDFLIRHNVAPGSPDMEAIKPFVAREFRLVTLDYLRGPQKPPKRGNPGGNSTTELIIFAEYTRQIEELPRGSSRNRLSEATAQALGPGVAAHHVRPIARKFSRLLGSIDEKWSEALLLAIICFRDTIEKFDDHTQRRRLRRRH
ncbi:hypothetical protein [uncultured Alsobacter sp.]|uniref:hypothetical protein n=1 Tax=uncultured Alsobacter sp. TaxID=1748258 RepID=UPI0025F51631|nr:hypothetical protein [uncultured Alsobacter sp.]